ncbi:DUF5983 family protein [Buttiauxella izardii]|uniref:YeeW-like domain-containing protein n=1 Tax=Buttiauxella izardii TaxID=82991 RepID=A0A3A5JND7_9ENTR|nr:DUF5983 family protein [Buttiauxella izardii]RJT19524.1 hypothetical protein D6029_18605 [Buttiauxella izardii]
MKISLNIEADSVNVRALNMGKIAVEVDGIELAELITAVNSTGDILIIGKEPGTFIIADPGSPQ